MKDRRRMKAKSGSHILGAKAFAAITAVEGLELSPAARKRIAEWRRRKLTPEQRRDEAIKAYAGAKGR